MNLNSDWQQWKYQYAEEIKHIVGFEEKFVDLVLSQIPEINPDDVIPQYHFFDNKGGNRYIDFMILNQQKGYCLPIELDGMWKHENYAEFNDFLERQNAIISHFGLVLRYSNKTMLNNSIMIIKELRDTLHNQSQAQSTQKIKDKHTTQLVADYEQRINELSKVNKNDTDLLPLLNDMKEEITQLKQQKIASTPTFKQQKYQPVNESNNHGILITGLVIIGLVGVVFWFVSNQQNSHEIVYEESEYESVQSNPAEIKPAEPKQAVQPKPIKPIEQPQIQVQTKPEQQYTVGVKQKVCGQVAQIKILPNKAYINLGKPYPNQDIAIVVWVKGDLNKYKNQYVCTTGKVTKYKGKLQVSVNNLRGLYVAN